MRKYKCTDPSGEEVDLDDPITYDHLPKNGRTLDDMMFKEIGHAICYMDYFHPDIFSGKNLQRMRVHKRIKIFCDNRKNHYKDVPWLQEQVFLFQDETENMC